jgi:hypothetical protein
MLDTGYWMLDDEIPVYVTSSLINPFYVPFVPIE